LSNDDWEGMCFCTQPDKDWDIKDGVFVNYGAGVYHFGATDEDKDSIYDEDTCELIVNKMKEVVLNAWENSYYKMVTKEELDEVWDKIVKNDTNDYVEIKI
jgi:hypothetical protein